MTRLANLAVLLVVGFVLGDITKFDMNLLLSIKKFKEYIPDPSGTYIAYLITSSTDKSNLDIVKNEIKALNLFDKSTLTLDSSVTSTFSNIVFARDPATRQDYIFYLKDGELTYNTFPSTLTNPIKLSNYPVALNSFKLNLEKGILIFTAFVYPEFGDFLSLTKSKDEAEKNKTFQVYESLVLPQKANQYWDLKMDQLFIQNLSIKSRSISLDGEVSNLINEKFEVINGWDLNHDATEIAYTRRQVAQRNPIDYISNIALIDLATKTTKVVSDGNSVISSPKYSPKGRLAVLSAVNLKATENRTIKVLNKLGGTFESIISSFYGDIINYNWVNENTIFFTSPNETTTINFILDLMKRLPDNLTALFDNIINVICHGTPQLIPFTNKFVVLRSSINKFPELYSIEHTGNSDAFSERLTKENWYPDLDIRLANFQVFTYPKIIDGITHLETGIIAYPYDLNTSNLYPVVLNILSNPKSSWTTEFTYTFNNPNLITSTGKVVVFINPTLPYGTPDVKYNFWSLDPVKDIIIGLNAAFDKYSWLDKKSKCLYGFSYGGFLVNLIRGNLDELKQQFNCYISQSGAFDIRSLSYSTYFPTQFQQQICTSASLSPICYPFDPDFSEIFDQSSPEKYIQNWDKSPHLIVHGQNDFIFPWSQANAMFTALQLNNIESYYLFFNQESHNISRNTNLIQLSTVALDFIDKKISQPIPTK